MSHQAAFEDIVRNRLSPRQFLPTPLSAEMLEAILEDAQTTPSNCNTQPWMVHIVSGAKLVALSQALIKANEADAESPDFTFDATAFPSPYRERRQAQGLQYYRSLGIDRDDHEARQASFLKNLEFFGAPHAAFLFMPTVGDNVRVAADVGMYGQTFLLSLAARGLNGIPQTLLGFYPETVRRFLGVPGDMKLLFGISFGYPDKTHVGFKNRMGRASIHENVTMHQ